MPAGLKKADQFVFLLALVFVLSLYYIYWGESKHAHQAEIIVAGKKPFMLDLAVDQTLEIDGVLGHSVVEVKEGRIRFVQSPCSGKLCIRSGWISQANDFTACLPNGITVHLIGPNARFDSINF